MLTWLIMLTAAASLDAGSALVHPDSCVAWAPFMEPTTLAILAAGSDCVATVIHAYTCCEALQGQYRCEAAMAIVGAFWPQVRADRRAAPGCLHINMPLQHSMHVCPGENYDFRSVAHHTVKRIICTCFAMTKLDVWSRIVESTGSDELSTSFDCTGCLCHLRMSHSHWWNWRRKCDC